MSVTSATESFTDGAELFEQDKYQSTVQTSLEPDTTQIEQEFKKPLSQRIIPMHSHTKSVYGESRLDDVIVRCPSLAFRDHQKQQWNDVKKEAEEKSWNWTITAMGAGVFAALGGALMAMDPAAVAGYVGTAIANSYLAPFVLVAGAVGAAVSIIFVANANSSINQANEQINKWDADPVMKVGQARNEAHKQGFPYIYANNLKLTSGQPSRTALFHPIQVEYEYKKYFESFCRNLLSQANPSPASWMNQFRSCNPVSASYMTYALGAVPDRMTLVIQDYSRLALLLEDIVKSYDQLKIDVRKTAKDRIDSYNKAKNEQLQPLAQARDEGIATAEDNKDRVLRDLNASDRRRREARETFNVIKESLQANYTRSAAPISKKYDGKIKEVENESNERIGKLDDQKGSQLGNNYRAARELLARAKQAWDNKGYQPVNFQQYFPYQTAQPVWVNQQPGYYQQQPPAYQQPVQVVYQQQPPVQQQPGYYQQPVQPVYQQQQPVYSQQTPSIYPPVLPSGNNGFGQYVYGQHVQNQIPAQQQYFYVQPTAPHERG